MERLRLGSTDMVANILGFGGSEIGYQNIAARARVRSPDPRGLPRR
jgi:hypothetical protein